jgi:hypothetical protein
MHGKLWLVLDEDDVIANFDQFKQGSEWILNRTPQS